MKTRISTQWKDYEILALGEGRKIEKYKNIVLNRPDPLAKGSLVYDGKVNAYYSDKWSKDTGDIIVKYKDMRLITRPTRSKHTGIFPEQATNWDFIRKACKEYKKEMRVLNLFGYTGGATVAAGLEENVVEVVHIDALKSVLQWTRDNVKLNSLEHKTIRTIQEDVLKFIQREIRRGNKYEAIIMDPPSYGTGPNKEKWTIHSLLPQLLQGVSELLSDNPCFVLVNTYSKDLPGEDVLSMLKSYLPYTKFYDVAEIGLPVKNQDRYLKAGYTTRWCFNERAL